MISKILLTLSLLVSPVVSLISNQALKADFDTFQSFEKYEQDFDYVLEYQSRDFVDPISFIYETDYAGEIYYYYVFPLSYSVEVSVFNNILSPFYSNSFYEFYNVSISYFAESVVYVELFNYVGSETQFSILALNSLSMSQVIQKDKELPENDKTLYGSFFAFFTGFFPQTVVAEYNGIFTAIVVAFLLFLVFGFIFFLFRTIRRLMGFR